jgi:hypothetical protein
MKTSWNTTTGENIETPQNVLDFLREIEHVYIKHKLSISHQDHHGAFVIEPYGEYNLRWLNQAELNLTEE